jgi:hypothetical protein
MNVAAGWQHDMDLSSYALSAPAALLGLDVPEDPTLAWILAAVLLGAGGLVGWVVKQHYARESREEAGIARIEKRLDGWMEGDYSPWSQAARIRACRKALNAVREDLGLRKDRDITDEGTVKESSIRRPQ